MYHNGISYEMLLDMFELEHITTYPLMKNRDKSVFIRHDIDTSIMKALPMACMEYERGIKSTFFILPTDYWDNTETWNVLRSIQSMGHEVGFHNSVVTDVIDKYGLLPENIGEDINLFIKKRIHEYLKRMRDEGLVVKGTSEHGATTCYTHKVRNRQVWDIYPSKPWLKQYSLRSFDLDYDCSAANALKQADKYGLENSVIHDELFIMDTSKGWWNFNPEELKWILTGRDKYKLHINVHPERWQ